MYLGQATEHLILSKLLAEGREVYLPTVDDHGVDALVLSKTPGPEGKRVYQELQIKSLSQGGLFAAISCPKPRPNYWFVFYVQSINTIWLINSEDLTNQDPYTKISSLNQQGKNIGKYSILLASKRGVRTATAGYIVTDFSTLP